MKFEVRFVDILLRNKQITSCYVNKFCLLFAADRRKTDFTKMQQNIQFFDCLYLKLTK